MKRPALFLTSLLLCLTVSLAALTVAHRPNTFSERENRMLAQPPVLTFSSLWDGTFASAAEKYLADQFYARDFWMSVRLYIRLAFGQCENGGVYIGKNRLFLVPGKPDEDAMQNTLRAVNAFAARHRDIRHFMAVVPNAICVMKDELPIAAPGLDQRTLLHTIAGALKDVTFLDTTDALCAKSSMPLYYRTDHHWTSLGAQTAFLAMAEDMGIEPIADYDVITVSDSFRGTLASKSGVTDRTDTIEIILPESDVLYSVTYAQEFRTEGTMFDKNALNEKDQYAVFFGGNHPLIDIQTTAESDRVLLLFKDSYANCFVPLLTPYFSRIVMVDPRYYYEDADSLVLRSGITDVLYLYNAETFAGDTALADTLAEMTE
ncbi:MAG: hypothetical protein J6X30_04020 [Clostridia bacterium]|nr:hypothetical protein [Clostridia bacterium]